MVKATKKKKRYVNNNNNCYTIRYIILLIRGNLFRVYNINLLDSSYKWLVKSKKLLVVTSDFLIVL